MTERAIRTGSHGRKWLLGNLLRLFLAAWVVIGGSVVGIVATGTIAGANSAAYTTTDVHGLTDIVRTVKGTLNTTPASGAYAPCTKGTTNNCNTYSNKVSVWLNGGPTSTTVTGTYFFSVISTGK